MFKNYKGLIIGIVVFFVSILLPEFGLKKVPFLPVRFLFIATAAIGMALIGRWLYNRGKQKDFFFLKAFGGFLLALGLMLLFVYINVVIVLFEQGLTNADDFFASMV